MDEGISEGLDRTVPKRMEGKINYMDLLIMGVVICTFFAGFYVGEKIQHEKDLGFYTDYLDNCECTTPLVTIDGRVSYEYVLDNPSNITGYVFHIPT